MYDGSMEWQSVWSLVPRMGTMDDTLLLLDVAEGVVALISIVERRASE